METSARWSISEVHMERDTMNSIPALVLGLVALAVIGFYGVAFITALIG
jgi:hypothetical protein